MKNMYTLDNVGTLETPRYAIMDDQGRYFNDQTEEWGEKRLCTLYSTPDAGCTQIQDMLLSQFSDEPMRQFVVPLIVNLHTKEGVTRDQVEEWLMQVVRIATDPNHRMSLGPVSNSLGILTLDVAQLKEVTKEVTVA